MGPLSEPYDALERARIKIVPDKPCVHKTYIFQLVDPIPWLPECTVYQACRANELHSLVGRHLISNGIPTRTLALSMLSLILKAFNPTTTAPISRSQVVLRKHDGASRRRYARAKESLDRHGPSINWARVSAFIKVEKWEQPLVEKRKPPRLIQFRTYPYCMELSRHLIPIEEHIWALRKHDIKVFAKGMSSFALGALFRAAYNLFPSPYVLMMDHSKFDASLTTELIELVEHGLYKEYSRDELLVSILKKQLKNFCISKSGVVYTCDGRKMSGEYNTSCGDSVINLAIIMHAMEETGVQYHPLINGDDSVIICDRDPGLSAEHFCKYGMKTEVEHCFEFEHIEFCQSRPVEVRPAVWRMVRNPERVMTRSVVSVKRYNGIGWAKLVNSIGLCEMACNDGVPVLQEFAAYLLRSAGRHTGDYIRSEISYRAALEPTLHPGAKPIQDAARLSFAKAFGFSPTEQIALENSLRAHTSVVHQMSKASAA